MAKKTAVKEKYAGPKGPMKVETPSPKKVKDVIEKDVLFIGDQLASIGERLNEAELSINDLTIKVSRIMGRMGL